ncbi:hypothetical protein [Synoicihabitans lomoniglobus]|uniref:Uncharacterized protein n=1 Tax=Synoicihabitans lomoniglobus TaxID=2909285 RepID=A0AAF0CRL4_9BACT|nr:hypothetical protein [Opitutaceae bacterium LMO-M01]WED66803.1 hypothetical protein PXH66_08065 [Opitutaceae bacterium LMO-M01]
MSASFRLLFCLCFIPVIASADGRELFERGFTAYQTNGPDALVNVWLLDQSKEAQTKAARDLRSSSEGLGEIIGFEVLTSIRISRRVERWFGVVYRRRGPVWVSADHYIGREEAGFVAFKSSRQVEDILPREMLVPPIE